MKKLSIITICYNEPNLEKTCESIVSQSWQDFEWIVIDGGSNNETLAIFDKYRSRIDKFVSEPDNGIYDACNKGINLATGKYLNFMNAGDLFYHNNVLQLFDCFNQHNNADVYYGECKYYKNQNNSYITNYPKVLSWNFFAMSNICMQGMFVKKEMFNKYGLFSEQYKIFADYAKWLYLFGLGVSFCYMPIVVATYDLNGISSTVNVNERLDIASHYFSKKQLKKIIKRFSRPKYTFAEKLFSIKNSSAKTYKILTIFGIHFKFQLKGKQYEL